MPPVNPSDALLNAPLADLVVLLLKQFKRLLAERGLGLTTAQLDALGQAAAQRQPLPNFAEALPALLAELIAESEATLRQRFGWTFAESLTRDMSAVEGWETTAEFLEIANLKSNHELRISAASSLLALLGDERGRANLWSVLDAEGEVQDVDGAFARRALCHLDGIEPQAADWRSLARR